MPTIARYTYCSALCAISTGLASKYTPLHVWGGGVAEVFDVKIGTKNT